MKEIFRVLVFISLLGSLSLSAADLVLPTTVPQSNDLDPIKLWQRATMSLSGMWSALTGKGTNMVRVNVVAGSATGETTTQTNILNKLDTILNTNALISARLDALSAKVDTLVATNAIISARVDAVTAQIANGIGLTNATAPLTNAPGEYLEVVPRAGTNAISGNLPAFAATPSFNLVSNTNQVQVANTNAVNIVQVGGVAISTTNITDCNITNTVAVTGWPLLVTNVTLTNMVGDGIIAGDSMGPGGWEVNGVSRTANGAAMLLCGTYLRTTNVTTDCIDVYITDRPITFPAASTAANISVSDLPYVLTTIRFGTNGVNADVGKPWQVVGTNMVCTQPFTIGLRPATNSIFFYRTAIVALTNGGSDTFKITVQNE